MEDKTAGIDFLSLFIDLIALMGEQAIAQVLAGGAAGAKPASRPEWMSVNEVMDLRVQEVARD